MSWWFFFTGMMGIFKKKESSGSDSWLFAGLGNPGAEHEGDRHNIGFMAADVIAGHHRFPAWRAKYQGLMAEGMIGGRKVILLKPQTYMNNSGQSIAAAAKFYKIPPARIAVFHDELDLPPGKLKIKQGGGNAGHNGLRSAEAHLGTADFWRVRMGIGHPGDREKVHGYVLGKFAKSDKAWIEALLACTATYAEMIAAGDMAGFMTKVAAEQQKECG